MAVKIGNRKKETKQGGGGSIEPQKPGMKAARLVQAIYLGEQEKTDWQTQQKTGEWEDTFLFVFECPQDRIDVEGESKPRWSSKTCVVSDFEKSNFYKICKALDSSYDPETTDPFELVGKPCMITVAHTRNGKAKIASVNPPLEGFSVPELENDTLTFTIDEPELEVFEKMMQWVKDSAVRYRGFSGSTLQKLVGSGQASTTNQGDDFDDDIPF